MREWELRAARPASASACRSWTTRAAAGRPSRSSASRSIPFGEIDARSVDPEARAEADWPRPARAYDECREEIALLLGEPGWHLTDAEPMIICSIRLVPGDDDDAGG